MASMVPPTDDETHNLFAYVDQQRDAFRQVAHGLTDEQARRRPVPTSELSIGGLVKHVAQMERGWVALAVDGTPPGYDPEGFTMLPEETLKVLLADLAACGRETRAALSGLDMDHPVPVPAGVPWFPKDVTAWSLRWMLAHLVEELARHAGHADLVREALDGKTMYELQAMADGRHEEYLAMMREALGGGS
ncbi:uncharacterized protein DUF664 [Stackebrandtia albiflava]|uniref:Uncharacterized protein DUF664 n=1 Tax=Stackebrandtia albiflava TaxID=406432 RepID=A0A562UYW1_9ACTN|nr:DinB family protein [Stackebrandtia albiflava]TWJ10795.1 uncharacterized protein DUF664 [Stackebrandtia albiflava]